MPMKQVSFGKRFLNRISSKLNSRSGVTILLALLLFLAASMVSVVIIGSAVSSVSRVQDDKSQEQSMETLISAAQLISAELGGAGVIRTETKSQSTGISRMTYEAAPQAASEKPRVLADQLISCVESVDQAPGSSWSTDFTVETSLQDMKPVHAELLMIREDEQAAADARFYKVAMTLTLEGDDTCYTFVDATANLSKGQPIASGSGENTVTTTTTTITWNEPLIHGAVRSTEG